jgi:ssDNA-binding replication factor A large subunit
MITIPFEQLREQVKQKSGISDEDFNSRIKKKMEELAGLISEEGAAHIVANELGVQLFSGSVVIKVSNLKAGMRHVDLLGKVVRKFDVREFQTQRGAGKVGSFVLGDETGSVRAVLWNKQTDQLAKFNEQDVLKIHSGYVRDNNGTLELHMNDHSDVQINPPGQDVNLTSEHKSLSTQRKKLSELKENDQNAEILVTIVDVYDPRYFTVCPQCNKRVNDANSSSQCATHGSVEPLVSYVSNVVVDDGSDTMRVTLWKRQCENLFKLSSDEMLKFRDFPEQFQDVKHKLLGETVKIVGNVKKNAMFDRIEFQANSMVLDPDPKEELERLEKAEQ